jgi:hypothetical protein
MVDLEDFGLREGIGRENCIHDVRVMFALNGWEERVVYSERSAQPVQKKPKGFQPTSGNMRKNCRCVKEKGNAGA